METLQHKDTNVLIDELESVMLSNFDVIDCPLKHRFVPGMYIREIFMPKGAVITSLIHKTNHPFFILQGKVSVFTEKDGVQVLEAPYVGITTPDTRRVLKIHEDTIWATCHATDIQPLDDSAEEIEKAVTLIGNQIIEQRENSLLGGMLKNNEILNLLKDNT